MSLSHATTFTPSAPDELWRLIFRFATLTEESSRLYDTDYTPFRESWLDRLVLDNSLVAKRSVVLVCKHWRSIAMEFLCEHISVEGFLRLRDAQGGSNFGEYIRRLELPTRPIKDTPRLVDVLQQCRRVQILVQPAWLGGRGDNESFWDNLTTGNDARVFDRIRRIDWSTLGTEHAYPTHLARLTAILRASSNLLYFSLRFSVDPFPSIRPSLSLLSVKTLRIHGKMGLPGLRLPNLVQIIVNDIQVTDSSQCVFLGIGPYLRILQLTGYGEGFRFDVLRLSPHLEEFCCTVNRDTILAIGELHPRVSTVRLYCAAYPCEGADVGFAKKSALLHDGTSFPALKRVVLHGSWGKFTEHPRFRMFSGFVGRSGVVVEYPDGRAVP